MPGSIAHGGRLRDRSQEPADAGLRLPRREHLPAALHQPLRRGGDKPAAVRHPERSRRPRELSGTSRSRSRPSRTSCSSAGASASTRCRSGAYFANYTQDNHWNFTDILTDVRDNPRFLDLIVTPPGGSPDSRHQERLPELPVRPTPTGPGQATIVSRRGGRRSPAHRPAARGSRCPGRVRRLRAELGEHLEVRPGRQPGHHLRQRDLRQRQLPPLHQQHHRLVRLARAQLSDSTTTGRSTPRGARGYKMPALDEFSERARPRRKWTCSRPRRCSRSRAASRPRSAAGRSP